VPPRRLRLALSGERVLREGGLLRHGSDAIAEVVVFGGAVVLLKRDYTCDGIRDGREIIGERAEAAGGERS